MNIISWLVITEDSGLTDQIRKILPAGRENQVIGMESLDGSPPSDISPEGWIGILDLDSFSVKLDSLPEQLGSQFSGLPLILLSSQNIPDPESLPGYYFHAQRDDLKSGTFLSLLQSLQQLVNLNYTKTQVETNLKQRLSELMLIRKASLHLTLNLALDNVLEAILESAMDLVSADDTHIFLYEHGVLTFAAALFDGQQQIEPYMHPRPHGITYQVAESGKKLVVSDTANHELFKDRPWEGAIISLPLKIGTSVLGVMNIALQRPHQFDEHEIQLLEFLADQAAIAIQNAKLYEKAQQEIADRKKAEQSIQKLAHHDPLTGLPNRRLFNERITQEIARSERNQLIFGVMLFDLDQLKGVNDSYGHHAGDLLLQAVAQRLLGLLRKSDTVARMGGDEFLLVLPELNVPADAIQTAERILSAVSTPFLLDSHHINITTSIGIVSYPADGEEVDELVRKADIAMYKAKQKGGNTYHFYTD